MHLASHLYKGKISILLLFSVLVIYALCFPYRAVITRKVQGRIFNLNCTLATQFKYVFEQANLGRQVKACPRGDKQHFSEHTS